MLNHAKKLRFGILKWNEDSENFNPYHCTEYAKPC